MKKAPAFTVAILSAVVVALAAAVVWLYFRPNTKLPGGGDIRDSMYAQNREVIWDATRPGTRVLQITGDDGLVRGVEAHREWVSNREDLNRKPKSDPTPEEVQRQIDEAVWYGR
jgi:hypothetical protein